jgi:O-methyltransferase involved in polyketide biosynthesis
MTLSPLGDWDADAGDGPPGLDIGVANPARMWNYWIGGKDHFAADREAADKVLEVLPSMLIIARLARRFLVASVARLAADYGIRQFLDIGTGLPTGDSTHEAAQRVAPESRIVYVDNDPVVLTHARALLTSSPEGRTDYLHADLRDTARILAEAARTLDFSQPVAVLLTGVLHFIPDADDPAAILARLMNAVPPGSFLVLTHGANDTQPEELDEMMKRYNERSSTPIMLRDREQVVGFFSGLDLIEPGVVPFDEWQADPAAPSGGGLAGYCGIGRKPQ